jgi:pimeloyl-ACP methyl ester carboxylesterase
VIWGDPDSYLGSDLAEPESDDVANLDRLERLTDASHWVHQDEAERVNQLLRTDACNRCGGSNGSKPAANVAVAWFRA